MLEVSLGLAALSLAEASLTGTFDLLMALLWFPNSFFIIIMLFYQITTYLGEEGPLDDLSIGLSLLANFTIALLALLLQGGSLVVRGMIGGEILDLLPPTVAIAAGCLGAIGIRYTGMNRDKLAAKQFDHARSEALSLFSMAPFLLLFTVFKPQIMETLISVVSEFVPASLVANLPMIMSINMGWAAFWGGWMVASPVAGVIFRIQEGRWSSHKM